MPLHFYHNPIPLQVTYSMFPNHCILVWHTCRCNMDSLSPKPCRWPMPASYVPFCTSTRLSGCSNVPPCLAAYPHFSRNPTPLHRKDIRMRNHYSLPIPFGRCNTGNRSHHICDLCLPASYGRFCISTRLSGCSHKSLILEKCHCFFRNPIPLTDREPLMQGHYIQ